MLACRMTLIHILPQPFPSLRSGSPQSFYAVRAVRDLRLAFDGFLRLDGLLCLFFYLFLSVTEGRRFVLHRLVVHSDTADLNDTDNSEEEVHSGESGKGKEKKKKKPEG